MTTPELDPGALQRALFDASPDAILVADGEGTVVLANPACERLLGYPLATLVGMSVDLLVPRRFAAHPRHRADFVAHPKSRPMGRGMGLVALRADGAEIPVDISLAPMALGDGKWTVCSLRDLRGRNTETLRIQSTALRSAANGIVITDRAGVIVWVNRAACQITGYAEGELVGQHTRVLKSGTHDPSFYRQLWETVSRGDTWSGTIVNRRKDGALYHEEQTIAPVLDEVGAVTHFIAIKQDVSARQQDQAALAAAHAELERRLGEIESLNQQLREQSLRDPLTGLHNRRYFAETIVREAARVSRHHEPLAVLALDLDHFKKVNDTWGHAAGDRVLRALAGVISAGVRTSDLLCRMGGEEFIAVMPGAALPIALARAEEWRAAVAALQFEEGPSLRCTVSIGVASFRPGHETVEQTLARADAALYEAKRGGRDRVVCAEPR
ncbi:MAG: diguanylate cyclase [Archangium sp.]|nr:diguanylate cyclase [Archangium sp.]